MPNKEINHNKFRFFLFAPAGHATEAEMEMAKKAQEIIVPPEIDDTLLQDTSLVLHHPAFRCIRQHPGEIPMFTVWMEGWQDWHMISGPT